MSVNVNSEEKTWSVGTLLYNKKTLLTLFLWLLWGDFCFTLMETLIPALMPLKLQQLNSPNLLIGLFLTTLPGILNATICPAVSFRSDRYRSKWGRRIPFMLLSSPFITLFLILIGFSDHISAVIAKSFSLNPNTTIFVLIGIFIVGFQFFNMFVASVYYYLFNDVVPKEFLGRFLALFRMVGSAAGALFNFFLLKYAQTHFSEIMIIAAIVYFIVFMAMCYKVKEGDYPPPEQNLDGKEGLWSSIKTFFAESFGHKMYWCFYMFTTFWAMSAAIGPFYILMYKSMGMTVDQFGKVSGIIGIITTLLLFPAGWISDKYHPIVTMRIAMVTLVITMPLFFIFLFRDFTPHQVLILYAAISAVTIPMTALYIAAELPTYMKILPKERYGQFSSSNAMVRSVGVIIAGLLSGGFMDYMKKIYAHTPNPNYYYRFAPVYQFVFLILSFVAFLLVYKIWKERGGIENYIAPAVNEKQKAERAQQGLMH